MAKATDISAPIITGISGTESPLSGIDLSSKAAFENAVRATGDTAYVEQYVQENPEKFLTPAQLYKLEQVGPEAFWGGANDSTGVSGNTAGLSTPTPTTALYKATDGKTFTDKDSYLLYQQNLDTKKQNRQSAYDLLYNEFKSYGLESLVADIKGLIEKDVPDSQFTLELRNSPKYQARFSANADRVNKGLRALNEATYLQLEDQYQNLMRNYGLPDTYWKRGDLGVQEGFTKLIANDVSPTELENRLQLAKDQIEKGPKEYMDAIKAFYPEINKSDLMAYVLDPTNALKSIQSKVSAAQIGGEYLRAGLLKPEEASAYAGRAAYLAQQGITAAEVRQDIPIIKQAAERGSQLAAFSKQSPYTQATAEEELYNLGGAADAAKRRKQLTELEQSRFLGRTGAGALQRERAGGF
jgi:hypothetical protein